MEVIGADGVSGDEAGYVTPLTDGRLVALLLRIDALADDCSRAALVVTAKPSALDYAAMVVDRERLKTQAHSHCRTAVTVSFCKR